MKKCNGLDGIGFQADTLEEVNSYFGKVYSVSEKERENVANNPSITSPIVVGDDETNYFQFYDTQTETYLEGDFHEIWKQVSDQLKQEREQNETQQQQTKLLAISNTKLAPTRFTLMAVAPKRDSPHASDLNRVIQLNIDSRMELLNELGKAIYNDCTDITLYLNKHGIRYFGSAKQIVQQLKTGYPIEGKQSANTESVLHDIRKERIIQRGMWGNQTHDLHKWNTILVEEVGEVAQAIQSVDKTCTWAKEDDAYNLYDELIQVAGVAVSFAEHLNLTGIGRGSSLDDEHLTKEERFDKQSNNPNLEIPMAVLDYLSMPKQEWTPEKKEDLINTYEKLKRLVKSLPDNN